MLRPIYTTLLESNFSIKEEAADPLFSTTTNRQSSRQRLTFSISKKQQQFAYQFCKQFGLWRIVGFTALIKTKIAA